MSWCVRFFVVFLMGELLWTAGSFANEYAVAPPADWVLPVTFSAESNVPVQSVSDGYYYELNHVQKRPDIAESYYHHVIRITSEQGVGLLSQLLFSFDPSYQQLVLHQIDIYRDGLKVDQLPLADISMLQRESALESQIYDGSKTLSAILKDVRVGDVMEYSYTIRGDNPVFEGIYYDQELTQWSCLVKQFVLRIVWPVGRALYAQPMGEAISTRTVASSLKGYEDHYFERSNSLPILVDSDLPSWFSPYAELYFSEAEDWRDVAQWGMKLYPKVVALSPELEAFIERIKHDNATQEERLLAALRFVQDDVRYLGVEMGAASHCPSPPSDVLKRRFGDCKDKTYLLYTMLQCMGINSHPALVSTYKRRFLKNQYPSPLVFNHVILVAELDGRRYWVDPAAKLQRGSLGDMRPPQYEKALILAPETAGLTDIPAARPDERPNETVLEVYNIQAPETNVAILTVNTVFRNAFADYMRNQLANSSRAEQEKNLLNYYSKIFPDIQSTQECQTYDDPVNNLISISEQYIITNIWVANEGRQVWTAAVYPLRLYDLLSLPQTRQRTMPLAVAHPVSFKQRTEIYFPYQIQVEAADIRLNDPGMQYRYEIGYTNEMIMLNYYYRSRSDFVRAADAAEHIQHITRIDDESAFVLSVPFSGAGSNSKMPCTALVVTFGVTLILGLFGVVRVFRYHPGEPVPVVVSDGAQKSGIGGWLVLFLFSLIFHPLSFVYLILDLLVSNPQEVWSLYAVPESSFYHPLLQPLLIYEVAMNTAALLFSVLLLVLFFQKRHSFPVVFCWFTCVVALAVTLDLGLGYSIPLVRENLSPKDYSDVSRAYVYTVVWVSYFRKSARVKNTFVVQ